MELTKRELIGALQECPENMLADVDATFSSEGAVTMNVQIFFRTDQPNAAKKAPPCWSPLEYPGKMFW